jgi:LysM repeat protein
MTLQEFWQDLQTNHIENNVLTLTASSLPAAPDINSAIQTFFTPVAHSDLIINITNQPSPDTILVIEGTLLGALFGQTNPSVRATFYIGANNTPELSLTIRAAASGNQWTFSTVFSDLSGTALDTLQFGSPSFVMISDQQDHSGQFSGVSLSRGWNFYGILQLTSQPLQYVSWLFSGTSPLPMGGPLTLTADAPDMLIKTLPAASILALGSVSLSLGVRAQSSHQQNPAALLTWIELFSDFSLGSGPTLLNVHLSTRLPRDYPGLLSLNARIDQPLTTALTDLSTLLGPGMSLSSLIPSRFPAAEQFALTEFSISFNPTERAITGLSMSVGFEDVQWPIVTNLIALNSVKASFNLASPLTPQTQNLTAVIYGSFQVGSGTNTGTLVVQMFLPNLVIKGYLLPTTAGLDAVAVITQFFGAVPSPGTSLTLTQLGITADPTNQVYLFSAVIQQDWTIPLGITDLTVKTLRLSISRTSTSFTAQIAGTVRFLNNDFWLGAQVRTVRLPNGSNSTQWVFSAALAPQNKITMQDVADTFLPASWRNLPDQVKTLAITKLSATFLTNPYTYSFSAAISWSLLLGSQTFLIAASFSLSSSRNSQSDAPTYSGMVEGTLSFNNLLLTVGYVFGANNNKLYFQLNQLQGEYYTQTQQLRINFGDLTIAQIIEYIVNLAEPGSRFHLSAPWDVLNNINLRNLALVVDFNKRSIEVSYNVNTNLGFMQVQAFGIVYTREYGQSQVRLKLTGDFLGQRYDDKNPLSWDALQEAPPITPGSSVKILEIYYLGIGQHISLQSNPSNMTQVIEAMQRSLVPVSDPGANPLAQTTGLQFNSASNWLIGAKFVVLSSFAVSIIFNDPQLYGLQISVNGPRAGVFQGLNFEILYRKINQSTGVFHIDLRLPNSIRQLEFGQVSVTLPNVTIDIYTNGGFRLDFGFTNDIRDFSRCFTLQIFPFVGRGGLYLAYLSGDTSTAVPRISNGSFNPVIEFGLVLSIGAGKSISRGPLSAGITVSVVGLLRGVLAWFNPTDTTARSDTYYRVQGTIGIVGQLYGSVDFDVVRADVSVTVYASATLTIEAYKKIIIRLQAGVEARASAKVWFVRVHFSFKTTLDVSFEIGSNRTTPWRVIPGSPPPSYRLSSPTARAAAVATTTEDLTARLLPRTSNPLNLASETDEPAVEITLYLVPTFSQALPKNVPTAPPPNWQTFPTGTSPFVTCTLLLFAENSIPPNTLAPDQMSTTSANADEKPFNLLMSRMLKWVINSLENKSDVVFATDLEDIARQLLDEEIVSEYFSYPIILDFCSQNFIFKIVPRAPDGSDPSMSGTFFPIIPEMTLAAAGADSDLLTVSFDTFKQVDSNYAAKINKYFALLAAKYSNAVEQNPEGQTQTSDTVQAATTDDVDSMAQYIFRVYFLMLTRTVVESSQELLRVYPYQVTSAQTTSLNSIIAQFPPAAFGYVSLQGDTADFLAAHFQVSLSDLSDANPEKIDPQNPDQPIPAGTSLTIPVRLTAQQIVVANQFEKILNSNTGAGDETGTQPAQTLPINGVTYQVRAGDKLSDIAANMTVNSDAMAVKNQNAEGLFRLGATFKVGTVNYTVRDGDSVESIAAYFGVPSQSLPGTITPGQQLQVANVSHVVDSRFIIPYVTAMGDTLDSIIQHYFPPDSTLTTDQQDERLDQLRAQIKAWNPNVDFSQPLLKATLISIPYTPTFNNLALYYLGQPLEQLPADVLSATLLQSDNLNNPSLLLPLSILDVPQIDHIIAAEDTFDSIASHYDLSLDTLAQSIAAQPNIFRQSTPPLTLTLPDVPAINISQLLALLVQSGALNEDASMVSRFLLHGLQLPDPQDPAFQGYTVKDMENPAVLSQVKTYPLYMLVGQEFKAPPATATDYQLTLTKPKGYNWIKFGETTDRMLLMPLTAGELSLVGQLSAATFDPAIQQFGELPFYTYVPERSSLSQPRAWQSAVLPPDTPCLVQLQGTAVQPSLWPIPGTLLQRVKAAAQDAERTYQIMIGTQSANTPMQANPANCYLWTTMINIDIQHIPDSNNYLVVGADEVGKGYLLDIWQYLSQSSNTDSATIYLLYSASPAGSDGGLISNDLDRTNTFILKTNLSTQSRSAAQPRRFAATEQAAPQAEAEASALPENYSASFGTAESAYLIKLLWECSVVRSGGYYLNYALADGSSGLPDNLFDQHANATLTLLILFKQQKQGGMQPIKSFNNSVIIGDSLDLAHANVFIQPPLHLVSVDGTETLQKIADGSNINGMSAGQLAVANQDLLGLLNVGGSIKVGNNTQTIADGDTFARLAANASPPVSVQTLGTDNASSASVLAPGSLMQFAAGQLHLQANVPPGHVGFRLTRPNPDPQATAESLPVDKQLQNLFSLLTYRILENDTFAASNVGVPLSPTQGIQDSTDGINTQAPADDTIWTYRQFMAVYPFVKASVASLLSQSPALPPRAENPYAGVGTNTQVQVELEFRDLYGANTTQSALGLQPPVRFYDNLVNISQWSNVSGFYSFGPVNDQPSLILEYLFKTDKYLPASGVDFQTGIQNARLDAVQFKLIYYQITQLYQRYQLLTSIGSLSSTEANADLGWIVEQSLLKLVVSILFFLQAVQRLTALTDASGPALASLADNFHVTVGDLVAANLNVELGTLYETSSASGVSLTVPQYFIFQTDNTVNSVVGSDTDRAAQLANDNKLLPMLAGTAVNTASRTYTVQYGQTLTLADIAATNKTTPDALGDENGTKPLSVGVKLRLEDITLSVPEVSPDNTLNAMANAFVEAFQARGDTRTIRPADITRNNAQVENFFLAPTTLVFSKYLVQPGDTLNSVAAALAEAPADLLARNYNSADATRSTPNLWDAGTPLFIGDASYRMQATDTLQSVADTYFMNPADLWNYSTNPTLAFKPSPAPLVIPLHVQLGANDGYAAYETADNETLSNIFDNMFVSVDEFLELNHDLRGLFKLQTLLVEGVQQAVTADDTIDSLAAKFNLQPASFVGSIMTMPGVLRAGALLIITSIKTARQDTLSMFAARYHFTSGEVAAVNSSLHDLLETQQDAVYVYQDNTYRYTIRPNDTFASVVAQLNVPNLAVSDLANANPNLKLKAYVTIVPPPRTAQIVAAVTMQLSQPILPLTVTLVEARDKAYVAQPFQNEAAVVGVETEVPAQVFEDDEMLSLQEFAQSFENVFSGVKLATGPDLNPTTEGRLTAEPGNSETSTRRKLWVVNFSQAKPNGIKFNIQADRPGFFGVKPLYTLPWSAAQVSIKPYTSGAGLSPDSALNNFEGVDLEAWVQTALSAIDLILSPKYALPLCGDESLLPYLRQIIYAKARLANALKNQVDFLFETTESIPESYLESAQQALKDQALIELSSVYQTDVLVQYPFNINSPYTDQLTAPRLSGKPMSGQYTIPANAGFETLARAFSVSAEYVAIVFQSVRGILNAPINVSYGTTKPVLTVSDSNTTLLDIAAYYGVDVAALADGLTVQGGATLFKQGAVINASNSSFTLQSDSNFIGVAESFGITVENLVIANQTVQQVLAPNTLLTLYVDGNAKSTTTAQTDTFVTLASKLDLSLAQFANALWNCDLNVNSGCGYSMNPGTKLYDLDLTPVYSFTTGKLPLVDGASQATFLLNVRDAANRKSIPLNLDYVVNDVEYDIDPNAVDDYRESSWLSFIIPLSSAWEQGTGNNARIGPTRIPIPLRGFPQPPVLSEQTAAPVDGDASHKKWSYRLQIEEHDIAAQDTTYLHIGFNVGSETMFEESQAAPPVPADVAQALAQFNSVYPEVQNDLDVLFAPESADNANVVLKAVAAFSDMVGALAAAWDTPPPATLSASSASDELMPEMHMYEIEPVVSDISSEQFAYLRLRPAYGTQESLWPQITDAQTGTLLPLLAQSATQSIYTYQQSVQSTLNLGFAFDRTGISPVYTDNLDIIRQQNGWGGACVRRNLNLIAGQTTNNTFVYRTPLSLFPNKVTPLIQVGHFDALNPEKSGPADVPETLATALSQFFQNLFTPAPTGGLTHFTIAVTAQFGYPLAGPISTLSGSNLGSALGGAIIGDSELLVSYTPLLMVPTYIFDVANDWKDEDGSFVYQLATNVEQVAQNTGVQARQGLFVFDVIVYSSIMSAGLLPILEWRNLYFSYLFLMPDALPAGQLGMAYDVLLVASGGTAPYDYKLTDGSIPLMVILDEQTGRLAGTPIYTGEYNFTITATDANGHQRVGDKRYSLEVKLPLQPDMLPDAALLTAYKQSIFADAGEAPYTYIVSNGILPDGLTLNPNTGEIAGTPTLPGSFEFKVQATDTNGNKGSQHYTLTVENLSASQYATQLRAEGDTAQVAAPEIKATYSGQFSQDAPGMISLLRSSFPGSTRTLTQIAWALAAAPYSNTTALTALNAAFPGTPLADLAAAIKAAYPAPTVLQQVSQLTASATSAQDAARPLRDSHGDLTALEMAVLLRMNFASTTQTLKEMGQALANAHYAAGDATATLREVYPLNSLADIAAAVNQFYVRHSG